MSASTLHIKPQLAFLRGRVKFGANNRGVQCHTVWGCFVNDKSVEISKFLSYVLRHEPGAIGIRLDSEGWANIHFLIKGANQAGKSITLEQLMRVVETSDKKRFTLSDDGQYIRAAQGHSNTSVTINHTEKTPPEFLYHGTATRFLESIMKEGLKPQQRQHVHLSADVQTALAVGERYGKPVVLKVLHWPCINRVLRFIKQIMGFG
jgi:putative RNA 2'-phosphotransferase